MGSIWVMPRTYAASEPAADPRPGPVKLDLVGLVGDRLHCQEVLTKPSILDNIKFHLKSIGVFLILVKAALT